MVERENEAAEIERLLWRLGAATHPVSENELKSTTDISEVHLKEILACLEDKQILRSVSVLRRKNNEYIRVYTLLRRSQNSDTSSQVSSQEEAFDHSTAAQSDNLGTESFHHQMEPFYSEPSVVGDFDSKESELVAEETTSSSDSLLPLNPHGNASERAVLVAMIKFPPLPDDEQRILLRLIKIGDQEARERLVSHSVRLVYFFVKRHVNTSDWIDFFQEGMMGLNHAIDKYDESKGAKFGTYAVPWIKHYLTRYRKNSLRGIRRPNHIEDRAERFLWATQRLSQIFGREPTRNEIADELGLTQVRVRSTGCERIRSRLA